MPLRPGIFRDPWSEFSDLEKRIENLISFVSGQRRVVDPLWSGARLFPLLNVRQIDNIFVVTAEIPGMRKEDLELRVEGDTLSIKGERKPLETGAELSYHRRERAVGTFQRSLTLPSRVDPENVKATYKDGILTITLQREKIAEPKQITISAE
jgi:HSP20 family protein